MNPSSQPLVELREAAVRLGTRTLWSDLTLSLQSGEFLAVLGPNGVGKTTLLKVLLGLVPLLSGEVLINGSPPRRGNDEVGYIPFDPEAANLMFSLVSSRYERASLIVTSNKPFSAWGEIFGDDVSRRR